MAETKAYAEATSVAVGSARPRAAARVRVFARKALSVAVSAMLALTMSPLLSSGVAVATPQVAETSEIAGGGGSELTEGASGVGDLPNSEAPADPETPADADDGGAAGAVDGEGAVPPAGSEQDPAEGTAAPDLGESADPAGLGAAADGASSEDGEPPAYADWRAVAEAVESGELQGEGAKPAGSGTEADPYTIGSAEAFAWWALLHADSHAKLDADVDLTMRDGEAMPWPGDSALSGELDGQGHTLAFATGGAGLFAEVSAEGAVRWLTLGRTEAEARAAADAEKPAAEAAATGTLAGSVAGTNEGEIEGVVNRMTVGFSADAPADAERFAGGIVAVNDGTIADCANLAPIANDATAGVSAAGGIAARGTGTIATSYNAGDVKAAQNAAYVVTLLDAEGDYASVVDDATCYLAPGEGVTYEGVSSAGADRPGALTASELQDAADRLNAGREGDAAAWQAGSDATRGFPAPSEPANPDAQAAPEAPALLSAEPRATYADWAAVGKLVYEKTLTGTDFLPSGMGTADNPYVIKTPEAFAAFSYAAFIDVSPLNGVAGSQDALRSTVEIDPSVPSLDMFGSKYSGKAPAYDGDGKLTNIGDALAWTPIGYEDPSAKNYFEGSFDGNGCVVSSLRIDVPTERGAGLFRVLTGGTIENVAVDGNSEISGNTEVGAIVGVVANIAGTTATIRNCSNAASVTGTDKRVGGITGSITGKSGVQQTIVGCTNSGEVSATTYVGGITGNSSYASITGCSNSGSITASTGYAGGIAGAGGNSQFEQCLNEGAVQAVIAGGGISAQGSRSFKACGNSGNVTVAGNSSMSAAGGIQGLGNGTASAPLVIADCYNTGAISAGTAAGLAGGLLGTTTPTATAVSDTICTVTNSYSAGAVLAPGGGSACALIGAQKASVSDPGLGLSLSGGFYADDVDGADSSVYLDKGVAGLTAKHGADMKAVAFAKELNGGKYIGDAAGTTSTVWTADAQKNGAANLKNGGFPVFGNFAMLADWAAVGAAVDAGTVGAKPTEQSVTWADGTTGTAYKISTPEQLAWFAYKVNNDSSAFQMKNAQLEADIDLSGLSYGGAAEAGANYANCLPWVPIGANLFYGGRFDGAGFRVENVRIDASLAAAGTMVGFFGGLIGKVERLVISSGRLEASNSGSAQMILGTFVGAATSGDAYVRDCASLMDVGGSGLPANSVVCGFAGLVDSADRVAGCYYAGEAQASVRDVFAFSQSGALTGVCYDKDKNPGASAGFSGASAMTTAELKGAATVALLNGSSGTAWGLDWTGRNGGYPVVLRTGDLAAPSGWYDIGKAVADGEGSFGSFKPAGTGADEANAVEIATPEALAWWGYQFDEGNAPAHVKLAADIDLSGLGYAGKEGAGAGAGHANCLEWNLSPLVAGTFDGGGHTVRNVRGQALFSAVTGTLKDLDVADSTFSVTALAGMLLSGGSVERCSAAADVKVNSATQTGGLVMQTDSGTALRDCWSRASVVSTGGAVGGLAGYVADGTAVQNCYAAPASLSGTGADGALFARLRSASSTLVVQNCYYQQSSLPVTGSGTVTGATALEASQMTTPLLAFELNATRTGADAPWTWNLLENGGYPVLGVPPVDVDAGTWGGIGALQNEDQLRRTEADIAADGYGSMGAVQASAPATAALSGSGTAGDPYVVRTPEALAWWANQVTTNNKGFTHDAAGANTATQFKGSHVELGANIDLAGLEYTGATETGAHHANCLEWTPIGTFTGYDTSTWDFRPGCVPFEGSFQGEARAIKNLRLEGKADRGTGFFGLLSTYQVNRVTFASGTLDVSGVGAGMSAGAFAAGTYGDASIENNAMLVDVVGTAPAGTYCAGVIGLATNDESLASSYYAGTIEDSSIQVIANSTGSGGFSASPFLYLDADNIADNDPEATRVTADQLRSWSAAYELGRYTAESVVDGKVWRKAKDASENNGFPVLLTDEEIAAGGHMDAASSWSDVGEWWDEFGYGMTGAGTTASPYQIDMPEQLAWLAYKVNDGSLAAANQNVKLTGAIDLSGNKYTGKSGTGGDEFADCLNWVPIGNSTINGNVYLGEFDGQGKTVSAMRSASSTAGECRGLFGSVKDGSISNLALSGGYVSTVGAAGGLVGMHASNAVIEDCTVDVSVQGANDCVAGVVAAAFPEKVDVRCCANLGSISSSGNTGTGGIVGGASGSLGALTIENCFNAGAIESTGRDAAGIYGRGSVSSGGKTIVVKNCYNAGTISGAKLSNSIAKVASGIALSNCYYDEAKCADAGVQSGEKPLTAEQLASWGAAYALGGGDGTQALSAMTTWRMAEDASENGGYPVLVKPGATGDAAHMQPASDWSDVGLWVDAFATDRKPAGDGAANPFQVGSPEQLAWLAYKVNDGSLAAANQNAKLTAPVDLAGNQYTGKSAADGAGDKFANCLRWAPIGSDARRYAGAFEGAGNGMKNMRVDMGSASDGGLFGVLGAGASVSNMGVDSGFSTSKAGRMAGTIGYVHGANVKVTGCWNGAEVLCATYNVGGVVGAINEASGTVISKCWNTGTVTQTGGDGVGGIVGKVHAGGNTITDCYNVGAVEGQSNAGGIVGNMQNSGYTIANCYNAGKVTGASSGSLVGNGSLNPTNSYYASDLGSAANVVKGTGVASDQLKTWGAAYALNGGDGAKMPADLTMWRMAASASDNGGYPVLVAPGAAGDAAHLQSASDWSDVGEWVQLTGTLKPSGTGAAASPFQIGTREALAWLAYMVNEHGSEATPGGVSWRGASAKLTADIDLQAAYGGADTKWVPLGNGDLSDGALTKTFTGTFDGDGRTVSNAATGSVSGAGGLVGTLEGTVRGVNVTASAFTGTTGAGGVVGMAGQGAVIERCSAAKDVTVSSTNYAGGLAGLLYKNASAKDCWTRATVAAGKVSGGFVGSLEGSSALSGCYAAAASVAGSSKKGSFASHEGTVGTVERCYFQSASGLGAAQTGNSSKFAERTALQMASPVMAFQLNDGRADNVWTQAALANDGYPTLGSAAVVLSGWADVGAVQDEGVLRRTVAVIDGSGFGTAGAVQTTAPATAALAGDGSAATPYVVRTPEALAWFAYMTNSDPSGFGAKSVQLGASIDLTGAGYGGTSAAPLQWASIMANGAGHGKPTGNYSGTFDGQGNTVAHMYQHNGSAANASSWGLVAFASGGTVKNVALEAVDIDVVPQGSSYVTVGGVVGQLTAGAKVQGCAVRSGTIKAKSSTIMTGGIVGDIHQGGGSIENCYARANVGENAAGKYGAGLLGRPCQAGPTIKNSYFAGKASNPICYTSPENVTCQNVLYDTAVFGSTASAKAGVTGATTAQLQSWGAAYQLNGGDGAKAFADASATWREAADASENGGYPVLCASGESLAPASDWGDVGAWVDAFATGKKPAGDGTESSPFQVGSPEALAWFSIQVDRALAAANHDIEITADIDLLGAPYTGKSGTAAADSLTWKPIGKSATKFKGSIAGGGHVVDHLYIDSPSGSTLGLVGYADYAVIDRLGIGADSSITGSSNVAAFMGICLANKESRVSNCWSRATVQARDYCGAFVGDDGDPIAFENCYNAGEARFGKMANATYRNCYADTENYADAAAVDPAASGGPVGVTTAQLQSWGAAYQLNGGDGAKAFADASATWREAADASENGGYPVLCASGESLAPASDWSDVGAWVDAFATAKKPSPKQLSWRDGTSAATGYELGSAEQLAWLAYKVNGNADAASQNAALTADIDLSGYAYTGKSEGAPGASFENCLEWVPMGVMYGAAFMGRFDGRGYAVSNLRLVCNALDDYVGFFGSTESSVIERTALVSGALDVQKGDSDSVATFVALPHGEIRDCYSLVDVVGPESANSTIGGFVGDGLSSNGSAPVRFVSCYYGGNHGKFFGWWEDGDPNDAISNSYLLGSQDRPSGNPWTDGTLAGLTADQLQSWGAAYQLNGPLNADGTQKALGDLKTWRVAADANENGGYPVLVKPGDIVAGMTPAHEWADVGLWVDAFAPSKRPAEEPAPDGLPDITASTPVYSIDTPEQLAWLAYKVNSDNAGYGSRNALLTANLDLFGSTYTGKSFDEAASDLDAHLKADALPWTPLGDWASGSTMHPFGGVLDGQGRTVSHLYTPASAFAGALVGWATGTVARVAVEASSVSGSNSAAAVVVNLKGTSASVRECSVGGGVRVQGEVAGGVASAASDGATVADCYSRASVAGGTYFRPAGVVCTVLNASVTNCYFAGTSDRAVVGTIDGGSLTAENNYYQEGSAVESPGAGSPTMLSAADMTASKGAALAGKLNASRLGKDAPWRADSKDANDGYPVLVLASAMASSWEEVGRMMEEGAEGMPAKPVYQTVQWPGESSAQYTYLIDTPEQLAWFSYMVRADNAAYGSRRVRLDADIDLAGLAYTGASEVGADYANCLEWLPIGHVSAGAPATFTGRFDGAGHVVKNLRLMGGSGSSGFFGAVFGGGVVENLGLESGSLGGVAVMGAGTLAGGYLHGTVRNCFSRVDVAASATGDGGGLVCWMGAGTIEDSYYAGSIAEGSAFKPVAGAAGGTMENLHYDSDKAPGKADAKAAGHATAQFATWGAAYALNGGDGAKPFADASGTWRTDTAGVNGGYPVLCASGESLAPASDWSDVGAWVDAFATGKKPQLADAASPFEIGTPEALAWFACKVNDGTLAAENQNAFLTADIDLSGNTYTGKSGTGGDEFADCLNWVPIGNSTIDGNVYLGEFDGQGKTVSAMRSASSTAGECRGLFGSAKDGSISNLVLSGGYVSNVNAAAALVGMHASNEIVEDCTVDVTVHGGGDSVAGVVAAAYPGSATVRRCANLGDVSSTGSAGTGGIVGGTTNANSLLAIENCYNTGTITASGRDAAGIYGRGSADSKKKTVAIKNCYNAGTVSGAQLSNSIGKIQPGVSLSNCYYDSAKCADASVQAGEKPLTAEQLASWGAAYALGGGDGAKALGELTTWRMAADGENGGFPVLVAPDATGDAAHMQPASDWSDVGAWVDAFATGRKPVEQSAPDSWGAAAGTKAYSIASPEQLAWLAYKVNADNAGFGSKNALLAAPVDLAGEAYTGRAVAAGAYEDCLAWSPIGTHTYKTGANAAFSGRFDGAGENVTNLRIAADMSQSSGLFGWESGATIERVALSSGLVDFSNGTYCGSIVGLAQGGTLRDSYSMLALTGAKASSNGGLIGQDEMVLRRNLYFAGERRSGLADGVSALVGHCYMEAAGNENCFYVDGGQAGRFDDVTYETYPLTGVEKLTPAELRSWKTAWRLNGKSYVGKGSGSSAVSSTTWTSNPKKADGSWTYGNEGYPVFGDLKLEKLVVSVDPNGVLAKPAGSDEPAKKVAGAITTPILVAHPLTGPVELLESPSVPAGVTLSDAAAVDAGFSTWGTDSANAKAALVAGTASLKADTAAGAVLSAADLSAIDLHAAAAYNAADAREVKFAVMDAAGGYEVAVTIEAVTSKTLDVTVSVETGASFELSPDGKLHEGVLAKEASVLKVNNSVPVAGHVASVMALPKDAEVAYPDGSKAKVSAVLSPTASKLAASTGSITDANKVRLLAGASTGTGNTAGLTPLAAALYYDPAKNTVPLAFSVPGNGQAAWKWGMDYTGTYLEPDGVFGFSMGYAFGLPTADVTAAQLSEKA